MTLPQCLQAGSSWFAKDQNFVHHSWACKPALCKLGLSLIFNTGNETRFFVCCLEYIKLTSTYLMVLNRNVWLFFRSFTGDWKYLSWLVHTHKQIILITALGPFLSPVEDTFSLTGVLKVGNLQLLLTLLKSHFTCLMHKAITVWLTLAHYLMLECDNETVHKQVGRYFRSHHDSTLTSYVIPNTLRLIELCRIFGVGAAHNPWVPDIQFLWCKRCLQGTYSGSRKSECPWKVASIP